MSTCLIILEWFHVMIFLKLPLKEYLHSLSSSPESPLEINLKKSSISSRTAPFSNRINRILNGAVHDGLIE